MAAFPAIEPLERSYSLGSHAISAATFANGDETRFLHGTVAFGVPVSLSFRALTLTQARLISDHFAGQGTIRPFTIPVELWRMHASRYDVLPAGFAWKYAAAPEETPASGGLFDVAVSLVAVG
jgi:non-ribosomal peptide synthetase component F